MQIAGNWNFLVSSQPGQGSINLQTGEVIRALVKDVTGQEVVLMIKGQPVVAQTEASLEAGQRVDLQVQEAKEGQILLQLVDSDSSKTSGQISTKVSVEVLLARNGLPNTPGNLLLAQTLIATGKEGIAQESLLLLSKSLSPNPSLPEVQALVQLFSKGFPLGSSHISPLQTLIEVFGGSIGQTVAGEGEWQSLAKMLLALPQGSSMLEGLSIGLGEERNMADKLANLQERLGLDLETRLYSLLTEGSNQTSRSSTSVKEALISLLQGGEGSNTPEILNTTRTLLQVLTGLQLLHGSKGDEGQLYLMGMFNWGINGEERSPFFLSFFRDEKGGQGLGEPSRQVTLKTQTPQLGSILAQIRFYGKQMSVGVVVETPAAQRAFNKYTEKLLDMMAGLPWEVQVLPCRLKTGKKEETKWFQKFVEPEITQRLDIRL